MGIVALVTALGGLVVAAPVPTAGAATVDVAVVCEVWADGSSSFPVTDVPVARGDTLAVTFSDSCLAPFEQVADARTPTGLASTYFSAYPGQGGTPAAGAYIGQYPSGATATWVVADDAPAGPMPLAGQAFDSYLMVCSNCGLGAMVRLVVGAPPSAPGVPTVTPAAGAATLSWSAPADPGDAAIASYVATASPGGASCQTTAPTTTCTIDGLVDGRSYTFTVVARSELGSSPASASSAPVVIGAVPDTVPDPAPSSTTTTTTGTTASAATGRVVTPTFTG